FDMVLYYDLESGECGYILPDESTEIIVNIYPMEGQYLKVYGPYTGPGYYVAEYFTPMGASISVWLFYDREQSIFIFANEEYIINADGSIDMLATEERIQDELKYVDERWAYVSEIRQPSIEDIEEFHRLRDVIETARTMTELYEYIEQINEFINAIQMGSGEVVYPSVPDLPGLEYDDTVGGATTIKPGDNIYDAGYTVNGEGYTVVYAA
ncbi:MAG: hypothetical protein J6Q85_06830, partial [Clostridia bacterium]|nr:hypothetical protein [Clostridia bacterium]